MATLSRDVNRSTFQEVLEHFDTAMLVTRAHDGELRARPMAIADRDESGDLWFVTSFDSPKAAEIRADDQVSVTMQSKARFLSISGRAEIVRDRAKIEALWRETWKVWFPNGKDDPAIALVRVVASEGEYWDQHGAKGLKYAFDAARGLIQGRRPDRDLEPERGQRLPIRSFLPSMLQFG